MERIQQAGITAAMTYAAAYAVRSATINMRYFSADEFGLWRALE